MIFSFAKVNNMLKTCCVYADLLSEKSIKTLAETQTHMFSAVI